MQHSTPKSGDSWSIGFVAVCLAVGWSTPVSTLEMRLEEVRNYAIPAGFSLDKSIVQSDRSGTTLIAATSKRGNGSACTVVVATAQSARAYPYRHASGGSVCQGITLHPKGGFFVRGFSAARQEGAIGGFTARIDGSGRERWLIPDTEIVQSDAFRGSYRRPQSELAYSPADDHLLLFTVGQLKLGMLGEKDITYASVVSGGELRVSARRLGTGVGVVGDVTVLEETAKILIVVHRSATDGVRFFKYDGQNKLSAFEPLGENWSERAVRAVRTGPDGTIYVLWTKDRSAELSTRVTAVNAEGREKWSRQYDPVPARGRTNQEQKTDAGSEGKKYRSPAGLWAGANRVVVSYRSKSTELRVLNASDGTERGTTPLSEMIPNRPLSIVHGPEGRLRLLVADPRAGRFRELQMRFGPSPGSDDAGTEDAGFSDTRSPGNSGGNTKGGKGCSIVGNPGRGTGPSPPLLGLALWAACIRRFLPDQT